jgi:hypothetical protein
VTSISPLSQIGHPDKKINKGTSELNNITDQIDLTDIYKTFHQTVAEYMFFSVAYETFSKKDHILQHKSSINRYKKTKIISCIFTRPQ